MRRFQFYKKRVWVPLKRRLSWNHHDRLNWNLYGAQRLWFDHPHQFWDC